jgi:mannose-6-phosphate isomerase-like protein (cupin superfamily)
MRVIDFPNQPDEEWRAGVMTRMRVSAINGGTQLCIFEQWCTPERGAPTHVHAVEEVLTVLAGQADIWVEDEHMPVLPGQSVVIPAGRRHGFKNIGTSTLHVQATLAAPIFEATFEDQDVTRRRWVPQRA